MARRDYVARTKTLLYGTGLGEKPSIRRFAAASAMAISGDTITFNLLAGEGDYVSAGDVLNKINETDKANSFTFYVLSKATDTIVAVNGYGGSATDAATTELNSALLEQNPLVPEYEIHQAIDTIFSKYLWPFVFKYNQRTVTPNLATYQAVANAAVEEIQRGYQLNAGRTYEVSVALEKNLHTTVSTSGGLIFFNELLDGSTVYLTTKERYVITDEVDNTDPLIQLVALGAAAFSLDSAVASAGMEKAKKESTERQIKATELWRAFLTMRQSWQEDLSREDHYIAVELG